MNYLKLTEELTKEFYDLLKREWEGVSAGKAVQVSIKTTYPKLGVKIEKLTIKDSIMGKKNKEMLQDLIVSAMNDACSKMDTEYMVFSQKYINSLEKSVEPSADGLDFLTKPNKGSAKVN